MRVLKYSHEFNKDIRRIYGVVYLEYTEINGGRYVGVVKVKWLPSGLHRVCNARGGFGWEV